MNSCGVPQAAPIQNEPMPGRRGYAGEKVLCIPVLLPRVARELLPARGGGPDGFAVFFLWGASGELPHGGHTSGTNPEENAEGRKSSACLTQLSGVARELLPPQVAPENCFHRRWRQRTASTAGGFIDKIFGWVYNNAVCCRGFPALDSKQRSVTP